MGELFDRRATLTVGTIQIKAYEDPRAALRFRFEVEKTLDPKPNKATVTIYNLNPTHGQALEGFDEVPVQIEAGYKDAKEVLFLGNLRTSGSQDVLPDTLTTIASGDGEKAMRTARVQATFAKTKPTDAVLRELARALGVQPGNLDKAVVRLKTALNTGPFSKGTVLSGSASREMTRVCGSLGLEWSIHNGALQILERGQVLQDRAILCSPLTGMLGSPTIDGKGVLTTRMLLATNVFPGRLLQLDSFRLKGGFRIIETKHTGDTHGSDWYVDIKAKRY
jgi:hypothetical protein